MSRTHRERSDDNQPEQHEQSLPHIPSRALDRPIVRPGSATRKR